MPTFCISECFNITFTAGARFCQALYRGLAPASIRIKNIQPHDQLLYIDEGNKKILKGKTVETSQSHQFQSLPVLLMQIVTMASARTKNVSALMASSTKRIALFWAVSTYTAGIFCFNKVHYM